MSTSPFASLEIVPDTVLAGDSVEIVISMVAGSGWPAGSVRLVFDLPGMLGQSRAAVHGREDPGYVQVYVSNPDVTWTGLAWNSEILEYATAKVTDRFSKKGSWGQRWYVLDLGGGLRAGDRIEFHWGDALRGHGTLTKITTVVPKPDFDGIIDLYLYRGHKNGIPDRGRDYEGVPRPVPDWQTQLKFRILPREPERARLVRHGRGATLAVFDRFWNPVHGVAPEDAVDGAVVPLKNAMGGFDYADHAVTVRKRGLPLLESPGMRNVHNGMHIFWGDLHVHSAYSLDCLEREKMPMTPGELMDFGRQVAGLDYMAVTDHHINWLESKCWIGKSNWDATMEDVERHHSDGAFAVIPGYEYGDARCDTNVYFPEPVPYSVIAHSEWVDVRLIWKALGGMDVMTIPHFHRPGTLPFGEWWTTDLRMEPVMELLSTHGSYEFEHVADFARPLRKDFREDRSGWWLLNRGHRYGIVGNSDGHKGHAGMNALTACFAKELTRESIWDAYRKRHVYATSNARIRLLFTANGQLMGAVLPRSGVREFHVSVQAESPILCVEVYHNGLRQSRWPGEGIAFSRDWRDDKDDAGWWLVRVVQVDRQVAVSSPVWFEQS